MSTRWTGQTRPKRARLPRTAAERGRLEPQCTAGHVIVSVPLVRRDPVREALGYAEDGDAPCGTISCTAAFDRARFEVDVVTLRDVGQ